MRADEAFARKLNARLTPTTWEERLRLLAEYASLRVAFSTSFSSEDQAITHAIVRGRHDMRIFTLDTGRLFEATQETHQRTRKTYGITIETYYPDAQLLHEYTQKHGVNGFYDNVENRLSCCHIRKVEPLARALEGTDVWISGVRREHSPERSDLEVAEWDAARGIVKVYPLLDVDTATLDGFVAQHDIPINPMYAQGFPSIGCAPCTRAVAPGEHSRSGRWWWEQESERECGLHFKDGKLVRAGKESAAHA